MEETASTTFPETNGNCSIVTNTCDTRDSMEKFIEVLRPLLNMPEERKDSSIDKLRAVVAQRVADDPKFRDRPFYKDLFQELLYIIEVHNYSDANSLLKEAIDELKYNVDVKPKLESPKELKLRIKKIKSLKLKMWRLHKKNQKYMEKEVDLNAEDFEEENSAFLKHQRNSRKILSIKKQILELQNKPLRTGLSNEKKYSFNGSEYSQINEAITNLINEMLVQSHKTKSEQRHRLLAAPDLAAVHQAIVKVAESNKLCLYDIEDYSKKMLRKIGEDLKSRRRMDNEYSFESYLRLDTIKPETVVAAEEEVELQEKFNEHKEKAVLDTENIIRQFEERENANETQVDFSEGVGLQVFTNEAAQEDDMKDEEEGESENSDSESDLDDEKENEEESSSDEGAVEDSDDEVQIMEVDASAASSTDNNVQ